MNEAQTMLTKYTDEDSIVYAMKNGKTMLTKYTDIDTLVHECEESAMETEQDYQEWQTIFHFADGSALVWESNDFWELPTNDAI